jgi:hypothetical protein
VDALKVLLRDVLTEILPMIGRRMSYWLTPWACGLLGAAAAGLAGVALWQVGAQGRSGPLPLVGELRAPPPRTVEEVAALRNNARRRLALSPTDAGAWVTLAYAARAEAGRCDVRCNDALAQAYRVGPLDALTFAWRARFALENWPALTPAVREQTIRHMRYAWSTPEGRLAIKDMGVSVREPSGRLAARMVAGSLRAQPLARPDS